MLSPRQRLVGCSLVTVAIVVQTLAMGRAIIALDLALLVALVAWLQTKWRPRARGIVRTYLLGLVAFAAHFGEEYATGFYRSWPSLLGYEWQPLQFVAFNAAWASLFVLAAVGAARRRPVAYLVVIFFAIGGGVLNGIGHVVLALATARYFPGLLTAPLMLIAGVAVLRSLYAAEATIETAP